MIVIEAPVFVVFKLGMLVDIISVASPSVPTPPLIEADNVSNVGAFNGDFLITVILSSERLVVLLEKFVV